MDLLATRAPIAPESSGRSANQLTSITYTKGATTIGDLTYTYDAAGRRTSVSGSLAATDLPAAVASAVYNANNQLTSWAGTALTYDLNGNMTGDGTNDSPALAQADVAVAMNSGTQAAKEAGNMVDLDSNPTKLIEIVEIGKQLLMTRGALTTFSIANDVSKYFAIIPAAFASTYPELGRLNLMALSSGILSAVIFNALIIVALIPFSEWAARKISSTVSRSWGSSSRRTIARFSSWRCSCASARNMGMYSEVSITLSGR